METDIKKIIEESIEVKKSISDETVKDVSNAVKIITECYKNKGKLLVCGNGGSAADAQHMVGELVGRFKMERKALPCLALTTNTSILTAWSNDYNFDSVFERQIEALGNKGDVLIGISTSGNSENVIKGINKAKEIGIKVITLVGRNGGKMKEKGDLNIIVNSNDTARIQEAHIMIIHILCELIEKNIFNKKNNSGC